MTGLPEILCSNPVRKLVIITGRPAEFTGEQRPGDYYGGYHIPS
jgi:hypothetical protein